jgi:hypothetical protein
MPHPDVSRRDLARHLAAGAALAFTGAAPATADDAPADSAAEPHVPPARSPVDAHMDWLLQRYPSVHLTQQQVEGIRRIVERRLAQSEALRQYPLDPADAPALVFAAWRGEA